MRSGSDDAACSTGEPSGGGSERLRRFSEELYLCFARRTDALFELIDAILDGGCVPSPPHLSLAAVHRRGWGSLYAALGRGHIEEEALRALLAGQRRPGPRPRLRSGPQLVAPLRRRVQYRKRILLSPEPPLSRTAHRCRVELPTHRRTRLFSRLLGRARRRPARQPCRGCPHR